MLKAGTSCCDITPPVGYLLQGHNARKKPSEQVHDPLYLKVLTVSDGRRRVAIVTSDLVYFPPEFIEQTRADVQRVAKMRAADLLLTAIHTHTGPFMFASNPEDPRLLKDYLSLLRRKIVGAILEAGHREVPSVLRWGQGAVNIGAINRRLKTAHGVQMMPNPKLPIDPQVTVIGVTRPDGQPLAVLFNYTCHPTTLAADIYQISADYPGVAQREVQRAYPGALAMFTNGCCGDVRPAIIEGNQFKGGSFADIERMGRSLAGEAIKVFEQAAPADNHRVGGCLEQMRLPLDIRRLPLTPALLDRHYAFYKRTLTCHYGAIDSWKDYWLAALKRGEAVPQFVPCDIQVLSMGDIRLAGISGETMVEIGLQIKERFPARLMLCGYANGVIGYVPTAAALRDGGYEANSFLHKPYAAPYAPAAERRIVNAVVNLLKRQPAHSPSRRTR
ncbi:MAG: neutral/alkaline non-lysosomal ceramidase N-terminal domain-containing protein [Kiritimatiellae bacterium]|nr:neutral/alkaline non-lysosomal ceramidase N-terminal domain-containing protein [Kiritimatiellia bacterium]